LLGGRSYATGRSSGSHGAQHGRSQLIDLNLRLSRSSIARHGVGDCGTFSFLAVS
jgi:hypothetical protein